MIYYGTLREIFSSNLTITHLVSDRNYTKIFTEQKKFFVSKNLSWVLAILETELPELHLFIYRRGKAVNIEKIKKQGDFLFFDGQVLDVSRRKIKQICQIIEAFNGASSGL